jgi:CRISPR-associated Cas5-like protein
MNGSVIIFDIESSFGAFHKEFSNSGGLLTHKIPPKTAISGMLGAMLGLSLEDTIAVFSTSRSIAVPLGPVCVFHMVYNCHYGGKSNEMNNISQEILVNPRYRIYIEIPRGVQVHTASIPDGPVKGLLQGKATIPLLDLLVATMAKDLRYFPMYMGKNEFFIHYARVDEPLQQVKEPAGVKATVRSPIPTRIVANYDASIKTQTASPSIWQHLAATKKRAYAVHLMDRVPQEELPSRDFMRFENYLMASEGGQLVVTLKADGLDGCSFYTNAASELIVLT